MKRLLLIGLTSTLICSSLSAKEVQKEEYFEKLKDSISIGFYTGKSYTSITSGDDISKTRPMDFEVRLGFEKKETHRLSAFINTKTKQTVKIDDKSYDYSSFNLGINYDFQIKNLDTKTSLFFGPSASILINLLEGEKKDKGIGFSIGGRIGIAQEISGCTDLEVYYQKDFNHIDMDLNANVGDTEKFMVGLLFKF